ncbi:MAG TPA: hypothetical protein VI457_12080 [Methylococcaceae bacterium]|nr:hypothetical protein [Methylococcaceae bacterium]
MSTHTTPRATNTTPHGAEPEQRAFTEIQAAIYIQMSPSFLRIARMAGDRANRTPPPPHVKIGRKVLYLRDDLDAWLERHRVSKPLPPAA